MDSRMMTPSADVIEHKYKVGGIHYHAALSAVVFLLFWVLGMWAVGLLFVSLVFFVVMVAGISIFPKTFVERLDFRSKEYYTECSSAFQREVFRVPFSSISELTLELRSDSAGDIYYYIEVWSDRGRFELPSSLHPNVGRYDRHTMESLRHRLLSQIRAA